MTLEDPIAIRAIFPGLYNTLSDVSHYDLITHKMCLSLHIDYGIILWGPAAKTKCHINLYPLYVLKKAIRIITDAKYNSHYSPLLKNYKY